MAKAFITPLHGIDWQIPLMGAVKPSPTFSCLVVAHHATVWCLQTGSLYMLDAVIPVKPIETVKHHSDIISL